MEIFFVCFCLLLMEVFPEGYQKIFNLNSEFLNLKHQKKLKVALVVNTREEKVVLTHTIGTFNIH